MLAVILGDPDVIKTHNLATFVRSSPWLNTGQRIISCYAIITYTPNIQWICSAHSLSVVAFLLAGHADPQQSGSPVTLWSVPHKGHPCSRRKQTCCSVPRGGQCEVLVSINVHVLDILQGTVNTG